MSEYIVTTEQLNWFLERMDETVAIPAAIAHLKPIVRCKDCKFFNDFHGLCHRPVLIVDGITNTRWVDGSDETEPICATSAEPGGFCAWGEARERESVEVWNQWNTDDVTCSEEL